MAIDPTDALVALTPGYRLNVLRQEAHAGNSLAMIELGLVYFEGVLRPKDLSLARRWFGAAARRDDPHAHLLLGFMQQTGQGGPRNFVLAQRSYRAAMARLPFLASIYLAGLAHAQGDTWSARDYYARAVAMPSSHGQREYRTEAMLYLSQTATHDNPNTPGSRAPGSLMNALQFNLSKTIQRK